MCVQFTVGQAAAGALHGDGARIAARLRREPLQRARRGWYRFVRRRALAQSQQRLPFRAGQDPQCAGLLPGRLLERLDHRGRAACMNSQIRAAPIAFTTCAVMLKPLA